MATVLLIGSGAREHALASKIGLSTNVRIVYVNPGNGGTDCMTELMAGEIGTLEEGRLKMVNICEDLISDYVMLLEFCDKKAVDLVVVGPEVPLAEGICDALFTSGIKCFGPQKRAAALEADKCFAKEFMVRHNIPTARFESFTSSIEAVSHINNANYPALVVKASGLAAGKGAFVCNTKKEACEIAKQILDDKTFGSAGDSIVIEEFLEGEEFSVLCFTDGKTIAVMPPTQDHKQVHEGDTGPNTGGMGAYGPCPQLDEKSLGMIGQQILQKTIDGMRNEGKEFVGIVYAGIMMTKDGPKVLEFNCRFGDPECQVLLSLLESDLYELMLQCVEGDLQPHKVAWKKNTFSVCIVLASAGYPGNYEKNKSISGIDKANAVPGVKVYEAGTKMLQDGGKVTSGGRVVSVCSTDVTLQGACNLASSGAACIKFDGSFHRRDIAWKGLEYLKIQSGMTYASCGVSISNGNNLIHQISPMVLRTSRSGCKANLGGFGALFDLESAGYTNPVLVSGTDGVGTKLMLAHESSCHSSIGQDLVAMCVNDILTHNAEPLFFLDYFACGKLQSKKAAEVIKGIASACQTAGCVLVGGETAEMPGMYSPNKYDLAGFAVGAYDKGRHLPLPRLKEIYPGDVIIGISSSGLHSNGFSLVRSVLKAANVRLNDPCPFEEGRTMIDSLLTPTAIYSRILLPILRENVAIKAVAHVTGGGIIENLSRVLPDSVRAELDAKRWNVHPVFGWLSKVGSVASQEMLRTFNCGIGMCLVVSVGSESKVLQQCMLATAPYGLTAYNVGVLENATPNKQRVVVRNFSPVLNGSWMPDETKMTDGSDAPAALETPKKAALAVLISGTGTNLQALIDHSIQENAHYVVSLVISNKKSAAGLDRAKKAGIPSAILNHKDYPDRESYDHAIHQVLIKEKIQIICLAGFMRLLSGWFTRKWQGRILNIHPSLLPSFKGMNAHEQVLKSGVMITGCTVHFVTEDLDAGPIIMQKAVDVERDDDVAMLSERVKVAEHLVFPAAVDLLATGKVSFSPASSTVIWN